jgi:hypothetical protein
MIARVLRTVNATRYVMPLREGGSLPGLIEADDEGMYVLKFRGAGQGRKALVAEVVAAGLARALDLPVPDLVLVEVDLALGRSEPDPEINDLISASAGLNLGVDFLPGALDFNPALPGDVGARFASEVVWFDALMTNVDRSARNPNLLVWHRRTWLIDHGAALYQHHAARPLIQRAADPFSAIADHVLLPLAAEVPDADERLASRLRRQELSDALSLVPDGWLGDDPAAERAVYVDYLAARLTPPRAFAEEARRRREAPAG